MRLALVLVLVLVAPSLGQERWAGRMGRFGAGMVVSDLALAGIHGDESAARMALDGPGKVEFLLGLATFDASLRGAEAAAQRIPGLSGKLGTGLKHNLVLGAALTLASSVRIDLNGLRWADLARGDVSKLAGARVRVTAPSALHVGTALAAFSLATPAWSAVKRGAGMFARAVGRRLATTAALKLALAVAPVPGAQVAAVALAVVDVGLAVLDVAGLFTTAHLLMEGAEAAGGVAKDAARLPLAEAKLERAVRGDDPLEQEAALEAALREHAAARDRAYAPVAVANEELAKALRALGVPREQLDRLAGQVLADWGEAGALPAFARALRELAARTPGADAALARHRARLRAELPAAATARAALYRREAELLARVGAPAESLERAAAQAEVDAAEARALLEPADRTESVGLARAVAEITTRGGPR